MTTGNTYVVQTIEYGTRAQHLTWRSKSDERWPNYNKIKSGFSIKLKIQSPISVRRIYFESKLNVNIRVSQQMINSSPQCLFYTLCINNGLYGSNSLYDQLLTLYFHALSDQKLPKTLIEFFTKSNWKRNWLSSIRTRIQLTRACHRACL